MKKILGLDLGTTSIGWAFVHEAENEKEQSKIIDLGVRVNPLTTDEQTNFEKGRTQTGSAERTMARSARRNLQRFKQRRNNLIEILSKHNIISEETILTENGSNTTFETLRLRSKAAKEKIEKNELARVLLAINKKRGYKSNRKANTADEGNIIDGMSVAIQLYENDITPGQYCYNLLTKDAKNLPDFYKSDLINEFEQIWNIQSKHYPNILDSELMAALEGQGSKNSTNIFKIQKSIYTADNKGKNKRLQAYQWRSKATQEQLPIEQVAYVLCEINSNINNSSDYLGAISDRSKSLYFNKETVGEFIYKQVKDNPHSRLKNQVFYRQDYLDEFERIWEVQKHFHKELTEELKKEIRDIIIFYQRRLKSQKGLINFCEFESQDINIRINEKIKTKTIGSRVCPKSSPLFQEFKIWQNISNLILLNKKDGTQHRVQENYSPDEIQSLYLELNTRGTLKKHEIIKLLVKKPKEWDLNYTEVQGNTTNLAFHTAFFNIIEDEGYDINFSKETAKKRNEIISEIFQSLGIDSSILEFNSDLSDINNEFGNQKSYQLWHLLYSYEGDNSKTGNDALYRKLKEHFGFTKEQAQHLLNISFQEDYGNLSSKAIRNILPYLRENDYSTACQLAGYNHSHSISKEENEKRELKEKLKLLPKNSLRNPVVEKILNQMVNVINTIIETPHLGKPDEIRIELARELKRNAKERKSMSQNIEEAKRKNDNTRKTLKEEFNISNPSRNDIIRYKLYEELKENGYKTLYSNQYISRSQIFSGDIDIEHILPKARIFDDSFSNKTLEFRSVNLKKGDETAIDFIESEYGEEALERYKDRIEVLYKNNGINKAKYQKLLKEGNDIDDGFIERDLKDSQYIAKQAKQMLLELCKTVISTSGTITDRLREDWGLINIMQELNIDKYRAMGMTKIEERRNGKKLEKIIDWTKRNDHRHHAMDALTVAFTQHNHVQYLNYLNARKNESHKEHKNIMAIQNKITVSEENKKRVFKLPMPRFRTEAKKALENILISHKAKNKVVTNNKNKIKGSNIVQDTLTPRGQLHKETIYGSSRYYETKEIKIGAKFDSEQISKVARRDYREAIEKRLEEFSGDPKKAFSGKNSPAKNPIFTKGNKEVPKKVKCVELVNRFTIRKDINEELKVEKLIDKGIQKILKERLEEYGGKPKLAFTNLDKNPIWLNKEKGIAIKKVAITGVANAEALRYKKDHNGANILDINNVEIPNDYVSTGNNHHIAIYKDEKGDLQEEVVSLYEAVTRINEGSPIINKNHPKGWKFLFSMKKNEMFIFPSDDFNHKEVDLLDPKNRNLISRHLFRVQKLSQRDYVFNHHLETSVANADKLKNKLLQTNTFHHIQTPNNLKNIVKIRTNHLGHIVHIGE